MDRRPLKTRDKKWVHAVTHVLLKTRVQPDQISILGLFFALGAGYFLWQSATTPSLFYLIGSMVFIQSRLLCNMMDGLIAVEGQRHSKTGDLFNEVPDRFEDIVILAGAGYAAGDATLGWIAAALSVLTAYIRGFGSSLGTPAFFVGPMAKPHRMFVVTLSCLVALFYDSHFVFKTGLYVIIAGTIITTARRILLIAENLRQK